MEGVARSAGRAASALAGRVLGRNAPRPVLVEPSCGAAVATWAGEGVDEEIEAILRRAVRHALLDHKRGNPIAVWKDGKVVILQPEEILTEDNTSEQEAESGADSGMMSR